MEANNLIDNQRDCCVCISPALPIRGLDFFLPTTTIGLSVLGWVITTPREARTWKSNWQSIVILGGMVILLALSRYIGIRLPITASRPPQTGNVLATIGVITLVVFSFTRVNKSGRTSLVAGFLIVLLFFLLLKIPTVTYQVSVLLRSITGQAREVASSLDIRWFGYSYIAFRLLHTIRDRQSGRLPMVSLAEYVVYLVFFPALAAGPIDRIDRFTIDQRREPNRTVEDWIFAGKRVVLGLFKKFVVADGLALIALNATNALQIQKTGWAWVILYAFAFQLYFDFSGYTDIAIGISRLMGFYLPENFNHPYLKSNLTQFWNNWHMTLTQWFRAYFFNPVTRALRSGRKAVSIPLIVFITQISTMVLIGLWHGVTRNFVLWGLLHGFGLFIHNRWSELTKAHFATLPPVAQKIFNISGTIITFHFIALSWILFALPTPASSWHFFQVLVGMV